MRLSAVETTSVMVAHARGVDHLAFSQNDRYEPRRFAMTSGNSGTGHRKGME